MSRPRVATAPQGVNEWEPPGDGARVSGKLFVVLLFACWLAPAIVLAIVFGGLAIWLPVVIAVVALGWVLGQRRLLLSNAVPATADDHPRVVSIAGGLATDLGMTLPGVFVSSARGPNAFVVPGALTLTNDLLESYTRTELEAVVAHCLIRLRSGGLGWALAAAAVRGSARWATPPVGRHVDARAAAVTRYPPALASAIEKALPARGSTAGLWFVADAPSHAPAAERVAELVDL